MKQLYDARRATDEEKALVHGTMDYVVTLGDTIVCHMQLPGVASTMASILNQEYAMWEKQENVRIAELEAAFGQLRNITTQVIGDNVHEISAEWLLIFVQNALKKAGGNG